MALSHVYKPARKWARSILTLICGVTIGASGASLMADANAAAPTANVVICGYGDPNGGCSQALLDLGHIPGGEPIATPWYPADLSPLGPGMSGSTAEGLPGTLAAINDFKSRGFRVRLHGYSQGSDLALAAATESHVEELRLYGSPFPAMGAFQGKLLNNDLVEPFLQTFGKLTTDRAIPANTVVNAFYNESDVWNNYVPDENDLAVTGFKLIETMGGSAHWIQPNFSASCVFVDAFGVTNYVTADANPATTNGCK